MCNKYVPCSIGPYYDAESAAIAEAGGTGGREQGSSPRCCLRKHVCTGSRPSTGSSKQAASKVAKLACKRVSM